MAWTATESEWKAFCKRGDVREIATARFGRLAILARDEGLLVPILLGDWELVQIRASELSEILELEICPGYQSVVAEDNVSSPSGSDQLCPKLSLPLGTVHRSRSFLLFASKAFVPPVVRRPTRFVGWRPSLWCWSALRQQADGKSAAFLPRLTLLLRRVLCLPRQASNDCCNGNQIQQDSDADEPR